jgi:pimeloyl-ACP methyl ester carboxylesterase
VENDNRFGQPEDLDRKARFVRFLQEKYGLRKKCVPVGFSCGGMIGIYFAERYPELVSCLYIDAPVVNFMSWPCHFGQENPKPGLGEILPALGLKNLAELMAYRKMPLDKIPSLIEKKIPLVMASGDSDTTVPYDENGIFVERAYKEAALPIEVYIKPGGDHHPHGIPDPTPIVDFILRYDV